MTKPYYEAPDFLEHVYTVNDPGADYSFSDVIIVRDTRDGKVYAAHDSGCSCPSPFESHKFPTDFTEIRTGEDLSNFIDAVEYTKYDPADVTAALAATRKVLT